MNAGDLWGTQEIFESKSPALLQPTSVDLASPFPSSCLSGQVYTMVESGVHSTSLGFEAKVTTLSQWLDDLNMSLTNSHVEAIATYRTSGCDYICTVGL